MTEIGLATMNPPSGRKSRRLDRPACARVRTPRSATIKAANLPHGTEGRLWIKSPGQHDRLLEPARRHRGDDRRRLARYGRRRLLDADGYLWFRGRKKQIIVHDGSNICPQEVEDSLLEHNAVESAGVIGVHDLVHGENVRAYITWRPDVTRPTIAELIQFSRARIGYKAPDEILVLDQMPLNATGKVDRVALQTNGRRHFQSALGVTGQFDSSLRDREEAHRSLLVQISGD